MKCRRPEPPPPRRYQKPKHHDASTSKQLHWAEQAPHDRLELNQELRRRYSLLESAKKTATDGATSPTDPTTSDGLPILTAEEIERAQILIARDQRKVDKKNNKLKPAEITKATSHATTTTPSNTNSEPSNSTCKTMSTVANPSLQAIKRTRLRKGATRTRIGG